jgi:hypothetical protein
MPTVANHIHGPTARSKRSIRPVGMCLVEDTKIMEFCNVSTSSIVLLKSVNIHHRQSEVSALVTAARNVDFPALRTPTMATSATILSVSLKRCRSPPWGPLRLAPFFRNLSTPVPSPPQPPRATSSVGSSKEIVPSSWIRWYCFSSIGVVSSFPYNTTSPSSSSWTDSSLSCSEASSIMVFFSCLSSIPKISRSILTTVPGGTRTTQSIPTRPLSYMRPPGPPSAARKLKRRSFRDKCPNRLKKQVESVIKDTPTDSMTIGTAVVPISRELASVLYDVTTTQADTLSITRRKMS